jgi:hypothetical protein
VSCVSIWVIPLHPKLFFETKCNCKCLSYRYMDNCVFASLANGDVLIYQRTPSNIVVQIVPNLLFHFRGSLIY